MSGRPIDFFRGRHAGVLLPLFSAASTRGWGIGEIPDLVPLAEWLRQGGFDLVQLLPVSEMASGQHSPYSAITAMAIDPIYIGLAEVAEFGALGGEKALGAAGRVKLARLRAAPSVRYTRIRRLKDPVLRACFDRFVEAELRQGTPRAQAFERFVEDEAWWLDDYALFRAIRGAFAEAPWWAWEPGLRAREPAALAATRARLADEVRFVEYLQWLADTQWREVRQAVAPVGLFGDLPFMVGADSADVWARQHAFRHDATIGTPPDAFSDTGQDWGLPVYRWEVFAGDDDAWMRERARRAAELFAGYRIDHLVGFYRTYFISRDKATRGFVPESEAEQAAQGERLMRVFIETGARVIAEDLGTIPDFVRGSLDRLGLPGFRVLRWEREWGEPGQPFRDPAAWPAASVATTSTHDTETLAEWWERADAEERALLVKLPRLAGRLDDQARIGVFDAVVRDRLLELVYASGSDLLLLPMQDVFGWRDRVNTPATISDANWTWRLPWAVDRMAESPEASERAAALRALAERFDRA